jgi:hypothetical protein
MDNKIMRKALTKGPIYGIRLSSAHKNAITIALSIPTSNKTAVYMTNKMRI